MRGGLRNRVGGRGPYMRIPPLLIVGIACLCCMAPQSALADDGAEVHRLTAQAEGMLWFGHAENGRVREFTEALQVLDRAEDVLDSTEMPDVDRTRLARRIEVLREDLALSIERSRERFFGAYPLARLILPFPMVVRQDDLTETLHYESANEAVRTAADRVVEDIVRFQYPHVVFRSEPRNRAFELEAMRAFFSANRPFAHSRAELVGALTADELAAYDRGDFDTRTMARLMEHIGASKLLVVTVREGADLPDGTLVMLDGVFFQSGSDGATDSFAHMGFSRARHPQLRWIAWVYLVLFGVALVLATRTSWSLTEPWPVLHRVAMGAALFAVGRVFAFVAVMLLWKIIPHSDASAVGASWWPGLLGLTMILGSGLVAWIAQARASRIVPGSRSSRAVGMIFVIATIGATAYFIEPLLLLEPDRGMAIFVPLLLASALLAGLTGNAVRTGPPVPQYFVVGPILVAPLVGLSLFAMSSARLWILVGVSGALCLAAWIRHRYAVAHGLEEAKPDEAEAERADAERLEELGKKIEKKLPI
jgi:hypothetical protein